MWCPASAVGSCAFWADHPLCRDVHGYWYFAILPWCVGSELCSVPESQCDNLSLLYNRAALIPPEGHLWLLHKPLLPNSSLSGDSCPAPAPGGMCGADVPMGAWRRALARGHAPLCPLPCGCRGLGRGDFCPGIPPLLSGAPRAAGEVDPAGNGFICPAALASTSETC